MSEQVLHQRTEHVEKCSQRNQFVANERTNVFEELCPTKLNWRIYFGTPKQVVVVVTVTVVVEIMLELIDLASEI